MAEHELNKIIDKDGEVFNLRDSTKLGKTGDSSNTTTTFTKASGDTSSITSGSKLSAIFTAISSFFATLKSLAFKDKVTDSDISGTISDSHIASESTWNGKYTKPSTGIPKTDLASAVQTSLGKADTALQRHQSVTDNNPTLAWGIKSKVGTVGSTDLHVTMPEADADVYPVSANSTSFSDVLAAYNANKKLILQLGFPLPGTLTAIYNIPLNRIVYSDSTPVIFVWVYTQDSLTGDTNRGVITTWSLGSTGWASETEYTYFADTAGLSNKASALMDFGDKDQQKVTRVGWAGSSIGKVIASGSSQSLSESSYLAAYYVADGIGHVKDVKAVNVTVGNATKAAAAEDSAKWSGWKIVVGSTGTDANTLYFV